MEETLVFCHHRSRSTYSRAYSTLDAQAARAWDVLRKLRGAELHHKTLTAIICDSIGVVDNTARMIVVELTERGRLKNDRGWMTIQ